ncbi:hypothetical protein BKA62DRAFT_509246 [Auriculariales sp. MPI-PUGE-AT-0066]|nr:hypothetical protein BKA62DRAFT_509246 [Auriculariales sp. MPI-PUGE-AT-0066]
MSNFPSNAVFVEDDDTSILYEPSRGAWSHTNDPRYSNASYHYATAANASALVGFRVEPDYVWLLAERTSESGRFSVTFIPSSGLPIHRDSKTETYIGIVVIFEADVPQGATEMLIQTEEPGQRLGVDQVVRLRPATRSTSSLSGSDQSPQSTPAGASTPTGSQASVSQSGATSTTSPSQRASYSSSTSTTSGLSSSAGSATSGFPPPMATPIDTGESAAQRTLPIGAILGIVIGSMLALLALILAAFLCLRQQRQRQLSKIEPVEAGDPPRLTVPGRTVDKSKFPETSASSAMGTTPTVSSGPSSTSQERALRDLSAAMSQSGMSVDSLFAALQRGRVQSINNGHPDETLPQYTTVTSSIETVALAM